MLHLFRFRPPSCCIQKNSILILFLSFSSIRAHTAPATGNTVIINVSFSIVFLDSHWCLLRSVDLNRLFNHRHRFESFVEQFKVDSPIFCQFLLVSSNPLSLFQVSCPFLTIFCPCFIMIYLFLTIFGGFSKFLTIIFSFLTIFLQTLSYFDHLCRRFSNFIYTRSIFLVLRTF